jgi:retron-type reverse transcriptase
MTEQQIIAAVRQLNGKEDFLTLINQIVADELGDSGKPFTMKQLNYYCRTSYKPQKRYRKFSIPKKSGKAPRTIMAPCPTLKSILRFVNIILRAVFVPSPHATGFVKGRSVRDNAALHVGKNYVFNTDLKDFFPSVSQYRVKKCLMYRPFNFTEEVANLVAGLCCVVDGVGKEYKGYLPQGSPCSPIITNIVCQVLDRKLAKLARKYNLTYSRYADDITFSSMHNIYQPDGEFLTELRNIINEERFSINDEKTRLQKRGERQEVTGLVVNAKVNTVREYVRDIQCVLYIWERYGFNVAYSRFLAKYLSSKTNPKSTSPNMCNVIEGKLLYLKMIVGEDSSVYRKLLSRFRVLNPQETHATNKITFISSCKYDDFVSLYNTEIIIEKQTTEDSRDQFVAHTLMSERESRIWISKKVIKKLESLDDQEAVSKLLKRCYVCLAQQSERSFWLLLLNDPMLNKDKAPGDGDTVQMADQNENNERMSASKFAEISSDALGNLLSLLEEAENDAEPLIDTGIIPDDSELIDISSVPDIYIPMEPDEESVNETFNGKVDDGALSTDQVLDELLKSKFEDLDILLKWDKNKKN